MVAIMYGRRYLGYAVNPRHIRHLLRQMGSVRPMQ
jgi:hypothetical protein